MTSVNVDDGLATQNKCSKPLFRLMNLIRETQCEVEVIKPVLDELEVMRLCHSFGMMSSVDVNDFDFDNLNAREFDEDFARFLRTGLFENRICAGDVRVQGLFGKQAQVIAVLADMKAWSNEMVTSLSALGEGVYCVKRKGTDTLNDTLVLFSWIRDELFQPQALRNTPTLVLRFLLVLAPDLICCTSASDLEQLRDAMIDSEKQPVEDLSSYSVSFCIEKQEDALDDTACVACTTVDLHDTLQDCSNVSFVKGSYPALVVTKTRKSEIRTEPFQKTFQRSAPLSFAAWVKAESQHYRIKLSGAIVHKSILCESLLREFQMWPEAQVTESWKARDEIRRRTYDELSKQVEDEIMKQRLIVKGVSKALFELEAPRTEAKNEDVSTYAHFREWVQTKGVWKLDRKSTLKLDIPLRLHEMKQALFELYLVDQKADLPTILGMCSTSTKTQLLERIAKRRAKRRLPDEKHKANWTPFGEKIAEPLARLEKQWWHAVESSFSAVRTAGLEKPKRDQDRAKYQVDEATKSIIRNEFDQLCTRLQANEGPVMTLNATTRKGSVACKGTKEVKASSFDVQEVVKISMGEGLTTVALETLGHYMVSPTEPHLACFTVKTRSALQVCISNDQMCVKLINLPPIEKAKKPLPATVKTIRAFGKFASIFDFDSRTRNMAFLAEDSVAIYKFNESFKHMDPLKVIDLGAHSTLTALPFQDVLLMEKSVYVTDSGGWSQRFNLTTDEISNTIKVAETDEHVQASRLIPFADKLAVGVVCFKSQSPGTSKGELTCVSVDNHRSLPAVPLEIEFLSNTLHPQCIDEGIGIVDPLAQRLYLFSIEVTVQSESCRLRKVADEKDAGVEVGLSECLRKRHWLYTFYHVFEKFPVQGLLNDGQRRPVSVLATCPVPASPGLAFENCHDFFSLLMSDLLALNKPLQGLDLTKGLSVWPASLECLMMTSMSLTTFFQTLITFLPIQICRAEANALTLLQNGRNEALEEPELEFEENSWGTPEIADSIRFGLLSPLLCAWQGTCVVITSMGKQSTGKSYFLNHLTGSSFAIAGNRCTDGAWMTVRVLKDVLLIVLDFEGLGSFERTDQEDVFLAVLNASLSMFTIFRMEMRLDKEVDGLFAKFQKGINLVKNDNRLFQGLLYMSVKDINTNDGRDVIAEFTSKMQKLLRANCEQNFLKDMYSGQVSINCSPPLGTAGYYTSLCRAKQFVDKIISAQAVSPFAYRSGDSFHDCIRLVLAKIATLDWTTLDETSQQLQMKNLHRKVPGVLRTGYLIPADFHTKANLSKCVMEPIVNTASEKALQTFETFAKQHPEWQEQWPDAQHFDWDAVEDMELDFGPSVCTQRGASTESIDSVFVDLFQQYLDITSKDVFELITETDYVHFDVLLSFLINRRKVKVALWVKEYLGPERFLEEWDEIEKCYFVPFEAQLKRCNQQCAHCQLKCMRSACHSHDEEHECGMTHVCRGLCAFCGKLSDRVDETPPCVCRAGHEGKCNCGEGHTCEEKCQLANASNCNLICEMKTGHEGTHRCSVKQHFCGMSCSATNCTGKCVASVEHEHSVHKCLSNQCNHLCEMSGCTERCSTANHFHDNEVVESAFCNTPNDAGHIKHMCNSSHVCNELCQEEGICSKAVRVSSSRFEGLYGTFDYDLKRMISVRNKCVRNLKPGEVNHLGSHLCGKNVSHGCTARCEACEYYCEKSYGHAGAHSTSHGNMQNLHFVAKKEEDAIEWNGRKYAPGEKGIAEMCGLYCSTGGRGHVHYLKCLHANSSDCVYSGIDDQRRHCDIATLTPQPEAELDEVLHAEYWKTIGWEDPCHSAIERAEFEKCPYLCDALEHKGEGKIPSGCDLPVWHHPAKMQTYGKYTYIHGHRFACSHVSSAGILHHILVLDCSGSMRGKPWYTLMKAVRKYLRGRNTSGANEDIVSVVTFGDEGRIVYERVKITKAADWYVTFHGGGTFYAKGLKEANALISRTNTKEYRPVLIFFTDGRPADRKEGLKVAQNIGRKYTVLGLEAFVVGFGKASELGLEELAEALGGKVSEVCSVDMLTEAFNSISVALGASAGLISSN